MLPLPRICLLSLPVQSKQEEYRCLGALTQGSAAICSRCHQAAPRYDELAERRFEFIPLWGFFVFLLYTMRRVDCRRCGAVVVEEVPWGDGKRTLTKALKALRYCVGGACDVADTNRPRPWFSHRELLSAVPPRGR